MPKLVRDKIPEIIIQNGQQPNIRILNDEEYKIELAKKLIEEANEFQSDLNIDELADVLEVIDAIIIAYGFDKDTLEKVKQKKNQERGKFDKKIFLN
jgi:predicted house-cleaning noncanonical NTP pyrophosphatase (MazG superfamily)